jgi:hypothetical protein
MAAPNRAAASYTTNGGTTVQFRRAYLSPRLWVAPPG